VTVPPGGPRRVREHDFHDLMRHRVMEVLLVSSPYDWFLLEEAGQISERVRGEFRNLDLHYGPGLTPASSGAEALRMAGEGRYQLILTTLRPGDMNAAELARRLRQEGLAIPVVGLAFDTRELREFLAHNDPSLFHRIFLWQGDTGILLAIVKDVEDRLNVEHDVRAVGVQVILLIEDNVRYYSSFLPVIYGELLRQSQRVITDAPNIAQKITRMRARPKILLCSTYEEAWSLFEAYRDDVLGVISDVEFPRGGVVAADAGLEFAREVRRPCPDVPVLLHSARPEHEETARASGADFVLKGSPLLLEELRRLMTGDFGFGDFVFRLPQGGEVGRATDLRTLEEQLRRVPAESIAYHAERNHFSKWLKARTEFALAQELRPRHSEEFGGVESLRAYLIEALAAYRRRRRRTTVADFERETFEASGDFHRMGGGSLGGKARGLAFVRLLLADARLDREYRGISIGVPPAVVLGTDVFDEFLEQSGLRDFALRSEDEAEVEARFVAAPFPEERSRDLAALLERADYPLSVRSSSLLEDSRFQPFTGVYETFMLANDHPFLGARLEELLRAVKRVYASTFSRRARSHVRATPYRLEQEKMAVVVQRIVGARHGTRFYPDLSGVARSYNFYATPPLHAEDGIAAVALGLGRTVVEGGNCVRFSPRDPQRRIEVSSVEGALRTSQRSFWALALGGDRPRPAGDDLRETAFGLDAAEADGTLAALASTYSAENDAVYDGISRPGVRLVTLDPLLKHRRFPLADILCRLLELGREGMGAPVEIEFAATLSPAGDAEPEVGILQMRPLALASDREELEIGTVPSSMLLCRSASVLGHGRVDDVCDVVVVDRQRFERARSQQVAQELSQLNAELVSEGRPYLLVGVGRWGSRDPWMGIPVTWDQIAGARVIVEAGFRDFKVTPSQGTHFFQNLVSFNVGYFTVNPDAGDGFVDWDWLAAQPVVRQTASVRLVRLPRPAVVKMDGHRGEGVILKPIEAPSPKARP